jgi:hypothetical protein
MEIRFYRDAESGLPHCLDHGVDDREVIEVFTNAPLRLCGRGGAYFALGQTDTGRYLKIIYRMHQGGVIFVITAYDLRGKALAAYRRRRRRKGGP